MAKINKFKGTSKAKKDTIDYNVKGAKKIAATRPVGRPRTGTVRGNLNFKPTEDQLFKWRQLEEDSGLSGIALLTFLMNKELKKYK